jgi:hypothetical protein
VQVMRVKAQVAREIDSRKHKFDPNLVMEIQSVFACGAFFNVLDQSGCDALDAVMPTLPETIDVNFLKNGSDFVVWKESVEKLYCLVMVKGQRNAYVIFKQERFVGRVN